MQLSQVQLLSHQSKISTRIELYMGTGPEYMRCQFTRLGYLSLDSNERSAFKARELKSVYLKSKGVFMKLLLHKCHINALNLHNQVGLIALNMLGAPIPRPGAPAPGGASYLPRPGGGLPAPHRCVAAEQQQQRRARCAYTARTRTPRHHAPPPPFHPPPHTHPTPLHPGAREGPPPLARA